MKQTFMQRWFGGTLIAEQLAGVSRLMAWLFGLIVVLLLVSGVATTVTSRQVESLATYGLDLGEFDLYLLQLRRNEKDFLDRRTTAELDKHAANAKLAREQVARLIASGTQSATDRQVLEGQQKNLERYLSAFKVAADTQVALGLDENAGLQGALRKAVRTAEENLAKAGAAELTTSMLQMRRHEKDFILRERDEYVQQHLAEQQRFKSLLSAARLDASVRSEVQREIEEYGQAFQKFVAGTLQVNKTVDAARKAAQDTEAPIAGLLQNAAEQRQAANRRAFSINLVLALLAIGALVGGGLALRQSLASLRTTAGSIQSGVAALQGAVDRVRAGEELKEGDGVQTQDEIGTVWRTVHGLLTERREAQLKAERENDQLNNSVIAILQSVHALSQRDLTARAPVTQDIIGTVSDSINALTDETSKVLHGVSQIAGQVATASGKVQSQAALVSKTAEDERANVGQMIESLANATQTMNQVSALAEQSNASAEQATQATDTALETVNGTVKGMESIRETIAETEKRIKRLGERSQEISGIVNLINTISERTHVLALNASMQAAVAGEAGRGFAVVAEEVQRLAESSRNATQQIGTLVSNIQLETNETISTVNRTIGQVVHGSEQAQKAGEQMRLTQEITGQLVALVRRIGDASTQQKEMSTHLLLAVQRIGASTDRTAEQIVAQNQETDTLLASARRLVESVNVFKLPQMA